MPTGEPVLTTMLPQPDEHIVWPEQSSSVDDMPKLPPEGNNPLTAYGLWQIHKERRRLKEEYLEHWNATVNRSGTGRPVDALIVPVEPYVAPPHGVLAYG